MMTDCDESRTETLKRIERILTDLEFGPRSMTSTMDGMKGVLDALGATATSGVLDVMEHADRLGFLSFGPCEHSDMGQALTRLSRIAADECPADSATRLLLGVSFGDHEYFMRDRGPCANAMLSRGLEWMTAMIGAFLDLADSDDLMATIRDEHERHRDECGPQELTPLVPFVANDMERDGIAPDPIWFGAELERRLRVFYDRIDDVRVASTFPDMDTATRWRIALGGSPSVPDFAQSVEFIDYIAACGNAIGNHNHGVAHGLTSCREARDGFSSRLTAALESDGRRDFSRVSDWAACFERMTLGRIDPIESILFGEIAYLRDDRLPADDCIPEDLENLIASETDSARLLSELDVMDVMRTASGLDPFITANLGLTVLDASLVADVIGMLADGCPKDMVVEMLISRIDAANADSDDDVMETLS